MHAIGKNPSPTSTRNKIKIEYISERQSSPYELVFGFELGPNPHSKKNKRIIITFRNKNLIKT